MASVMPAFVPPPALSARTVGFRCRLSPFKSSDFVASFTVRFLIALDVLNDLARQLLSAIIRTSEHFHVFSTLRR